MKYGFHLLVFSVALMILVLLLIGSRKICDALLAKISKVSHFKKLEDRLEISYEGMHRLLQWRILVYPVFEVFLLGSLNVSDCTWLCSDWTPPWLCIP